MFFSCRRIRVITEQEFSVCYFEVVERFRADLLGVPRYRHERLIAFQAEAIERRARAVFPRWRPIMEAVTPREKQLILDRHETLLDEMRRVGSIARAHFLSGVEVHTAF